MKKKLIITESQYRRLINEGLFDGFGNLFGKKKKINKEIPNDEVERFTCKDCGNYDYDMYMVNDDIWKRYGNDSNTLCLSCLEKRMGRELRKDDFSEYKKTPVNQNNSKVSKSLKEQRLSYNEKVSNVLDKPYFHNMIEQFGITDKNDQLEVMKYILGDDIILDNTFGGNSILNNNRKTIYHEKVDGYWFYQEFDKDGYKLYYENSVDGVIDDYR